MSEQQINQATASAEAVETAPVEAAPVEALEAEAEAVNTEAVEAPVAEAETVEAEAVETEAAEAETVENAVAQTPDASAEPPAAPEPPRAEVPAQAAQDAGQDAGQDAEQGPDGQPVVRMLSVGQQVKGIVKRITEFGAFVDIGVGRDGLVHISELSAKRVGKVSDVLQEGQEVGLWIKKLDRERNRISLTMIEPGKRTIRDLQKGEVVEGTVTRLLPYGAFIDIGIGRDALLHVREMAEGFVAKPEDVVQVGQTVEVRVIEIARRRSRVDLSMKGLRPEPEPSAQPQREGAENGEPSAQGQPEQLARQDRPQRQPRSDGQGQGQGQRGGQGERQGQGRSEQFQQRYQGSRQGDRQGRGDRDRDRDRRREPEPEIIIEADPNDQFADMEVLTPMQLAFKRAQEKSGVVLPTGKGKGEHRQDTAKKRAQQEDIMARTLTSGRK